MNQKLQLSAFVVLLTLHTNYMSVCQEDSVYRGTGVDHCNGGCNSDILSNQTIILGGLFPVHTNENNACGRVRAHIIQLVEAMVLTVHRINNDTNFLPGVTLAYEIRDTCIRSNYALEQTLSFITGNEQTPVVTAGINAGVSGVVGAAFSSVSIAIASLLRLFRIPQISYASTAEILSDKTRFDYFFRTIPSDSLQARAIAATIINFNWTYAIAIHSDDAYGTGGIASLQKELQSFNSSSQVCLATVIPVSDSATSKDFSGIVDRINREWVANSSIVVLFGHLSQAEGIFEAILQKQEIDSKFVERNITWIGSDGWGDNVPPRYNKIAQGLLSTIPQVPSSNIFNDYFLSLHPSKNNTRNPWFSEYWEEIFNCSLGGRKDAEPCDLDNQAQSRENEYRPNSIVPFVVDAVYAFAHAIHNIQKNNCTGSEEGLCPKILETQLKGRVVRGDLLRRYLHNISFEGTSADRIEFDENGDQLGGYSIVNLQVNTNGSYSYVKVGSWDRHRAIPLIIHGDIQWKNGSGGVPVCICSQPCGGGEYRQPVVNQAECCWICRQCGGSRQVSDGLECRECNLGFRPNREKTSCVYIQPTFLIWSDPLAVVIIILSLLGIVATSFVIIVFVIYHNNLLIKASSRELSAVLLCGIMLCYLMPFIYIAKPSQATCAIQRFGVGFCFSLCFSALLVKTNRIHRIFNRKMLTLQAPPLVNPQSQLFFTALLVAIQVLIAVVWLIVEQPNTTFLYDEFTTHLICSEDPYIGLSVTLAYNLLLLIGTTYFAFRTRKVLQNFNEAKFINLTVYTLCVLWLAFIPTYFITTALRTTFRTGSLVIAIILSATVTLCCLLIPKMYFLFSRKRKGSTGIHTSTIQGPVMTSNILTDKSSYVKSGLVDAAIQTDSMSE